MVNESASEQEYRVGPIWTLALRRRYSRRDHRYVYFGQSRYYHAYDGDKCGHSSPFHRTIQTVSFLPLFCCTVDTRTIGSTLSITFASQAIVFHRYVYFSTALTYI